MRFLRKTTLLLLLILCLAPLSTLAAEEGDNHDNSIVVTQHHEVCFTSDSSSLATDFVLSSYMFTEVNDSISLDFEAEILNVTQNDTEMSVSGYTISWEYFSLDNTTRVSESGDHFSTEFETLSEEMGVLWSLTITSNDDSTIDGVCVDTIYSLHVAVEETHEEEGSVLGNLAISIIIVLSVPTLVMIAFNRFS